SARAPSSTPPTCWVTCPRRWTATTTTTTRAGRIGHGTRYHARAAPAARGAVRGDREQRDLCDRPRVRDLLAGRAVLGGALDRAGAGARVLASHAVLEPGDLRGHALVGAGGAGARG